jgi:hypothetical protein
MKKRKTALAIAAGVSLGALGFAGGSAEAARCGGMPDGVVVLPGPNETWDNPGEVISFVVTNLGPDELLRPPGQLVKAVCQGAPGG